MVSAKSLRPDRSTMGEQNATPFERLVLPHLDDAYTLARYLLRDEHDAQDAVQEAVLRGLRYFESFRGDDARAWLLTIVRNYCYTWLRDRAGRATVPFSDDETTEIADAHATDDLVLQSSESERIHAAVDALPTELREVIVLRELNELSYKEISEVVGVPMGTVMSRLSRARNRLAAALGTDSRRAG
jgi:RNA polymerase sigma-70 factor, ECF subfamily